MRHRHTGSAGWSWREESNLQPAVYKTAALPIELRQRLEKINGSAGLMSRLIRDRCPTAPVPARGHDLVFRMIKRSVIGNIMT